MKKIFLIFLIFIFQTNIALTANSLNNNDKTDILWRPGENSGQS